MLLMITDSVGELIGIYVAVGGSAQSGGGLGFLFLQVYFRQVYRQKKCSISWRRSNLLLPGPSVCRLILQGNYDMILGRGIVK